MTTFVFANNIDTTLASSISSSATLITLSSGTNLPTLAAGQTFVVTLNDAATQQVFEVMYATAISGTTLTVSRAQEGTTAQAWAAGDYVFSGPTAGQMRSFYQGQSVGQGTVTSVGMSMPSGFSVSGSPVTTAGTMSVTFASQSAGLFLATPVTGGAAGAATWRSMAAADVNGALGYTAANAADVVNTFNGRLGDVTLSATDVDNALGYTPANDAAVVHIAGMETITGAKTFTGGATYSGSSFSAASVQFLNGGSGNAQAVWCGQRYVGTTDIEFVATTDPSNTSADFMRVKTSGDMVLQGSMTCTTFNATSSDRHLKRNIRKFKARPLHRSVPLVSYTLKSNGWHGLGSIAQNVQKIAPEHVGEFEQDGKKYLSLNYAGMAYEQAIWAGLEVDRLTLRVAKLERSLDRAKIEPRKRGFVRRMMEAIW